MSSKKPDADTGGAGKAGGGDLADELHAEGTEVLGDSPEDVLVLLPDGTDIPVVETEAVEGEFGATNTEIVDGPGVSYEDVPLKDSNPLATDFAPAAASAPPPENIEELASDMDDEFLAPDPPAAARAKRSRAERGTERAMPQYYPPADHGTERKRHRWRAPMAIAALLAVAATGYLTFPQWKPYVESYLPGMVTSSAHAKPAPPPVSKTSAVATKTASKGPAGGPGDTKAVDMVRASKEAFREKFLLSIELGYVGEVADE